MIFGMDLFKCFTSTHEGRQVLDFVHEVRIKHACELGLEETFDFVLKA